jgi:hypothetical protein
MDKLKFLGVILAISFLANAYFVTQFFFLRIELNEVGENVKAQQKDEKSLFFAKLFVDKVMSGDKEVSFEDRLKLENAVREVDDQEIFSHWQNFVNSKTDTGAQQEAGVMLSLLLNKISQ